MENENNRKPHCEEYKSEVQSHYYTHFEHRRKTNERYQVVDSHAPAPPVPHWFVYTCSIVFCFMVSNNYAPSEHQAESAVCAFGQAGARRWGVGGGSTCGGFVGRGRRCPEEGRRPLGGNKKTYYQLAVHK